MAENKEQKLIRGRQEAKEKYIKLRDEEYFKSKAIVKPLLDAYIEADLALRLFYKDNDNIDAYYEINNTAKLMRTKKKTK